MPRLGISRVNPAVCLGMAAAIGLTFPHASVLAIPKDTQAPLRTSDDVHFVKRGESLWRIAKVRLGNGTHWPRLYRLNRSLIGNNPGVIHPGMRLRLRAVGMGSQAAERVMPEAVLPVAPPVVKTMADPDRESPSVSTEVGSPSLEVVPVPNGVSAHESGAPSEVRLPQASAPGAWDYLPVATSLVVPGSGQTLQGRWEKGLVHMGVMAASLMAFKSGTDQGDRPLQVMAGVGLLGITLWSPWDAYLGLPTSNPSGGMSLP